MSDTANLIGHGVTIGVDGSTILGVLSISGPDGTADMADVTTMDSTEFKEFQKGQVDPGDASLSLAYRTETVLTQLYKTGAKGDFTITFPTTTVADATFSGYVTGMGREIPKGELITRSVTIKVDGDPGY